MSSSAGPLQEQAKRVTKQAKELKKLIEDGGCTKAPMQKKLVDWIDNNGGLDHVRDALLLEYPYDVLVTLCEKAKTGMPIMGKSTISRWKKMLMDKIKEVYDAVKKPVPEDNRRCHWCDASEGTVLCQGCGQVFLHHFCLISNVPVVAEVNSGARVCRGCSRKELDKLLKAADQKQLQEYCKLMDLPVDGSVKDLRARLRENSCFKSNEELEVSLTHACM